MMKTPFLPSPRGETEQWVRFDIRSKVNAGRLSALILPSCMSTEAVAPPPTDHAVDPCALTFHITAVLFRVNNATAAPAASAVISKS